MAESGVFFNSLQQIPILHSAPGSELFADFGTRFALKDFTQTSSAGGVALCLEGRIPITVESTNFLITVPAPSNEYETTQIFVESLQPNSTYVATAIGGTKSVSGTYGIYSKLCVPKKLNATSSLHTLQILTHGGTLDMNYWDFALDYSYVDAAAEAGYVTFSYDRLGTGKSEHPDPLQVVQAPMHVEILHQLIEGLKASCSAVGACESVVGVGHSAGSQIMQGLTTKYPKDCNAIILSGTSASLDSLGVVTAGFALQNANADPSGRFSHLQDGYLLQGAVLHAVQFPYWRHPNFDPKILKMAFDTRQTNSLGELLSLGSVFTPSPEYTGPVGVVNGMNDFVFCGGDCSLPVDQAQSVIDVFYPAADASGSETYLQPGAGHVLAQHLNAKLGFEHMISFLQKNGLF